MLGAKTPSDSSIITKEFFEPKMSVDGDKKYFQLPKSTLHSSCLKTLITKPNCFINNSVNTPLLSMALCKKKLPLRSSEYVRISRLISQLPLSHWRPSSLHSTFLPQMIITPFQSHRYVIMARAAGRSCCSSAFRQCML